ncbi:hypothetical protein FRC03_010318 [Tulasnella sp. 419]|nr:hypothetical protein FRC03_010318 [Tulasnella sp. 419]
MGKATTTKSPRHQPYPKAAGRPRNTRSRSTTPSSRPSSPAETIFDPNNLPGSTPLYRPHGPWEFMADGVIESKIRLKSLNSGRMSSAHIDLVTAHGRTFPVICKEWNIWKDWDGFFSELYLYSSPDHLRNLQGIYVPHIIGVIGSIDEGVVCILMELPHSTTVGWTEARPGGKASPAIIEAYKAIHAAGVLHNDVELRHMIVTPDDKAMIIDFQMSRSLKPNRDVSLRSCTPGELKAEMRKVEYMLDYNDARRREEESWDDLAQKRYQANRAERANNIHVPLMSDEEWDEYAQEFALIDPRDGFKNVHIPSNERRYEVPSLNLPIWTPTRASGSETPQSAEAPSAGEPAPSTSKQAQDASHSQGDDPAPQVGPYKKRKRGEDNDEAEPVRRKQIRTEVTVAASSESPLLQQEVPNVVVEVPQTDKGKKRKRHEVEDTELIRRKLSRTEAFVKSEEVEVSLIEGGPSQPLPQSNQQIDIPTSSQPLRRSRRTPHVAKEVQPAPSATNRKRSNRKADEPAPLRREETATTIEVRSDGTSQNSGLSQQLSTSSSQQVENPPLARHSRRQPPAVIKNPTPAPKGNSSKKGPKKEEVRAPRAGRKTNAKVYKREEQEALPTSSRRLRPRKGSS